MRCGDVLGPAWLALHGSDLGELADDLDRLGIPVVAGFSTHPHWDHLLWHPRFGEVPRYATPAGAQTASDARERAQRMAAESASGIPLETRAAQAQAMPTAAWENPQ